jgi:hypothetical protein
VNNPAQLAETTLSHINCSFQVKWGIDGSFLALILHHRQNMESCCRSCIKTCVQDMRPFSGTVGASYGSVYLSSMYPDYSRSRTKRGLKPSGISFRE